MDTGKGDEYLKADTIAKDYVRNNDIFADIFNYYIYGGEQVIQPEQLTERDTVETALPYGEDGAAVPVQKYRDLQKLYAVMRDDKAEYRLCGTELQSEVHYAMAVKNNLYDALEYAGQVEEAARSHSQEMEKRRKNPEAYREKPRPNSGEFLSGFWRSDRLIPSVTVCVYFGAKEWDGPLSLFDMMDEVDPRFRACMSDYRVHLIAPALMTDEDIMKLQSSLREVMFFIKYSKDKTALNRILETNQERFRRLERRAADVIKAVTNSKIKYDEKEAYIDMCQAEKDMCQESWDNGKAEGKAEGRAEGITKGVIISLQNLMANTGWPIEQALTTLGVPQDEWERYTQLSRQQ